MPDILNRDAVRADLLRLELGVDGAANVMGLRPETLSRILNGRAPDLESLVRIHTGLATAEARSRRIRR